MHPAPCSGGNELWRAIIDAEVNTSQWTLMHRFHKAADIINEVGPGEQNTQLLLESVVMGMRNWQCWDGGCPLGLCRPLLACALDSPAQVLDGFFEVDQAAALADIYVWLRYSASRQLTWQRNYNTQPRILSAAQVGWQRLAWPKWPLSEPPTTQLCAGLKGPQACAPEAGAALNIARALGPDCCCHVSPLTTACRSA